MPLARFSVFAFLLVTLDLNARQPPNASQSPRRDAQAVAILTHAMDAAGGLSAINGVADFTAAGDVTYNWTNQAVSGTVRVYEKGLSEFRMDADLPSGRQSVVVNGTDAEFISVTGQTSYPPFYSMPTTGSLTFPALRAAAALNDPATSVSYTGPLTRNESQVYQIHVAPPVDPSLTFGGALAAVGSFDLEIDSRSYQIVEFSETVWSSTDSTQAYSHAIIFSNYTTINGLSMPFGITEKLGGQQTWCMTLASISFNNGLSDSLFTFYQPDETAASFLGRRE